MPKIIGGTIQEHREQTRNKIFTALTELMQDRGFDNITLAEIARAAGVGRTAMYNHFANKEDLLIAFIDSQTTAYTDSLRRALEDIEDPVDKLEAYVRQQAELNKVYHVAAGPSLTQALSPEGQQKIMGHVRIVSALLTEILQDGMDSGMFLQGDLRTTVSLVNACLSGRTIPHEDGPARTRAIEASVNFVLRAISNPRLLARVRLVS